MARLRTAVVQKPDKLVSYWKREWAAVAAVVIFGTFFNASMPYIAILQGRVIDTIAGGRELQTVLRQAEIFILAVLLVQLARFLKRYYIRLFANRTSASMRRMIYNNIMNKDLQELTGEKTGDLMTKAIGDVDICVEGMRKVTTEVFDTGVLMLSYFVSMLAYDRWLTIAACIFVPAAMYLAERLKQVIERYTREARAQSSYVAGLIYDRMEHALLYRVNGLEGANREKYGEQLEDLERKSVRATILENSMQPVYNLIAMLGIVFVLYFGGKNVIAQAWTVGMFSAYIVIFTAVSTKASKAAKLFNSFQKAKVSWLRIKPYLKDYQEKPAIDRFATDTKNAAELCVQQLTFTYPESNRPILSDISFSASKGEIIGITGSVACGKTTLGRVLQGFYPYHGSILLNGMELADYTEYERSERISFMGHMPQLLSETIYENITLGDAGDISQVLADVCFTEDLQTMPEGIWTVVGNGGVRLSGGQQARIALARALYRKSQLVILDDPFSAVDRATEEQIMRNLKTHYADRTILLISHRLAVFPETDHILVLPKLTEVQGSESESGGADYGTHAFLMEHSKVYRRLYELQEKGGAADE